MEDNALFLIELSAAIQEADEALFAEPEAPRWVTMEETWYPRLVAEAAAEETLEEAA